MKGKVIGMLAVLGWGIHAIGAPSNKPEPLSGKEIYTKIINSVVIIQTNLGTGTGFFMKNGEYVATNFHVIAGAKTINLRTHDGSEWKVDTVRFIKKHDMAILHLAKPSACKPLTLRNTSAVSPGDTVFVLGNPLGAFEFSISSGLVSAIRKTGKTTLLQITAPISPGSSGSPVVNVKGEVIGVAQSIVEEGQALNFAIASQHLWEVFGKPATKFADIAKETVDDEGDSDVSKNGPAFKKHASELFADYYDRITDEVVLWHVAVTRYLASSKGRAQWKNGPTHAKKVTASVLACDGLLTYLDGSSLLRPDSMKEFVTNVKSIAEAARECGESNAANIPTIRDPNTSKADRDKAVNDLNGCTASLELSHLNLIKKISIEPWFDMAAFTDRISPTTYFLLLTRFQIANVVPNVNLMNLCAVSLGNDRSRLHSGDVIIGAKITGDTYTKIGNWRDLTLFLNKLPDDAKEVTLQVQRDLIVDIQVPIEKRR